MARCIDCGYLAARAVESRQLVEVEKDVRETGVPPVRPSDRFYSQERAPVCFVGAADLHEEILAELGSLVPGTDRKQVLDGLNGLFLVKQWERERPDCDARRMFTKWQMGFSPKEHREMIDRQRRDTSEAGQRRSDRKWRVFEAVLFILAGAATAVVGALVERGDWLR